MSLPIQGNAALVLAVLLGAVFGLLLHRGGVTSYNVIVNQFRLRDFTVLRVMLTAVIVGGIGVLVLHSLDNAAGDPLARYHVKPAQLLGVTMGSAIFGIGMVLYGYCPGTGVAAIATGSVHALVGALGMLVGGAAYAFSYPWVKANLLGVADQGKVRLPEVTPLNDWAWFAVLAVIAVAVFALLRVLERRNAPLTSA
jgi:uncharacterized membrane protein YedE/YeeE